MMTREGLKNVALAQVGKPYVAHGWGPHGFDCIGLATYPGRVGRIWNHKRDEEPDPEIRCYSQEPDPKTMRRGLEKYFTRIPKGELEESAAIGDLLWFRSPKAQHLGVIVRKIGSKYWVVHADMRRMKVRLERVRNNAYIVCGWRYPELDNG